MAANVNEIVNKQVANFSVMYIKLHNFHWYVKGEQFFTLHEKFEELYTETATIIDDLAERLLALEGSVAGRSGHKMETPTSPAGSTLAQCSGGRGPVVRFAAPVVPGGLDAALSAILRTVKGEIHGSD